MSAATLRYPTYKRVTSAIVLLMVALWAGYLLLWPNPGASAAGLGVPNGKPAPDFELKTVEGKAIKLSDLKGKAVMINFFATWCPPCRAEMPTLQEVYKQYEAQGFVVLAVDLNEPEVAIRSFRDSLGLTFPIVVDKDDKVSRMYDIVPLPTSYFVDKKGIVHTKWTGEIRKEQLEAVVKQLVQ